MKKKKKKNTEGFSLSYTGCLATKYIQLKMFMFEKVRNKFKQIFHGCEVFGCLHLEVFIE